MGGMLKVFLSVILERLAFFVFGLKLHAAEHETLLNNGGSLRARGFLSQKARTHD